MKALLVGADRRVGRCRGGYGRGRADLVDLTLQGDLPAERWRWYAELQPRWREEGRDLDSLLVRPAIYYKLSEQGSVWLGYGHITNYPASGGMRYENRLWQQYLHTFAPWHGITFSSRTRLEERRLEKGDDTGYRLRQMLRASRPFESAPAWGWIVWDELFVNGNDTDWGARSGTDQNLAFAGLSYQWSGSRLEAGYLNQYIHAHGEDKMNHVLSAAWSINF